MKHLFFLFVFFYCIISASYSQPSKGVKLDENTLVKDTSGMIYPYSVWQKLLSTREYTLRPINSKDTQEGFLLIKLTEKEIEKRDSLAVKPKESSFFETGKSISNFKERDVNGYKWNLKDLKGKIVVLNFWFVNCPPCRMEIPALNKVVEKYQADSAVVFLSLCLDEKSSIEQLMLTTPFKYKIIDNARYICQQYKVTSYPTHVVLDKEGKVQYHTSGLSQGTVPWLKKTIDLLLKKDDQL